MNETVLTGTARRNFVVVSLLFHWSLIGAILVYGDASNSLHTSALGWAFVASIATFSAYVFGAVWDNLIVSRKA
jgi:hypothetical protein